MGKENIINTNLPKGWVTAVISDLITKDGLFCDGDWVETKDQEPSGEVRLIQLADIGDGYFKNKSDKFLTYTKSKELRCTYLKNGDILIARLPEPLGRACIFPFKEESKFITVVDVCIVRVNPTLINPKYFLSLINSPQIRLEIDKYKSGSTRKRISRKNLDNIKLFIAPLAEQHRIVAKIEELFSELDKGIESLKKAQEQLKIYRQAVLKQAFEGKLTEKWREQQLKEGNLESAESLLLKIKQERERLYQQQLDEWEQATKEWEASGKQGKKPAKPTQPKKLQVLSKQEVLQLSKLPSSWLWIKLAEITQISGGVTKNSKREFFDIKLPYLRVANVYANQLGLKNILEIGLTKEEIDRVLLQKDDILIVEGNGSIEQIGRVAIWNGSINPCVHQNHIIKARAINLMRPKIILYFFLSYEGREFIKNEASSTSGLYTLSLSKVENLKIPIFCLLEQDKIIEEIAMRLSICDRLSTTITENLQRAQALRQSILKRAFDGKLVPQDPNDEPAEKLLERIKKEKNQIK